ncbi:MAG: lysophospholipid acyltransferase family protein [Acidobacteriota bacterium]
MTAPPRGAAPESAAREASPRRPGGRTRHLLEYLLLRGVLAGVDALPPAGACSAARGLATVWWALDGRRRRVAVENILAAGVETDRRAARRLSRLSAQHFGQVIIESLKSSAVLESDRADELCRLEIAPDVLEVLEDPSRGLIMASGHFGNWEIAAHRLSRWKPVAGITREMNNPRVDALLHKRKGRYRFRPIPKYAADPRRFLSVLESGEILALLMDQHAHTGGVSAPFFGRPASTHTTAAMLHLVTRTPLCFASCRRVGPMRFVLETSPLIEHPATGKKKDDVRAILDRLHGYLEEVIRRDPDQYGWGHRRWRDESVA